MFLRRWATYFLMIWGYFLELHCHVNGQDEHRVKREQLCRGSQDNGSGFCVSTDRLLSNCMGRMAVAQQSRDCGPDEWCCQRSGRRFLVTAHGNKLKKSPVDNVPCGLGSTNRNMFRNLGPDNIRRFARIFNGNPVDEGDVCWIAAIFDKGNLTLGIPFTFLCAGAIINSTHIVTAAHCVDRLLQDPNQLVVQTGTINASPGLRSADDGCVQQFFVDHVEIPSEYDPDSLDRDFALIRIKGVVKANECTCRACLLDREVSGNSMVTCWTAGFGATREGGTSSLQLTKTMIDFVRRDRCEVLLGSQLSGQQRFKLAKSAICAGDVQRGGICYNDGGAPLTCVIAKKLECDSPSSPKKMPNRNSELISDRKGCSMAPCTQNGRHTLVGLGSWSVDCSKMPSVFSSIMSCPDVLNDLNAPCNLEDSARRASVALTNLDIVGTPTCGVPGTNEIDPFGISNQSQEKQLLDAGKVKKDARTMKRTKLTNEMGFQMMSNESVPEIISDDIVIVPKQSPVLIGNKTIQQLFPAQTIIGGSVVPANQICWQVLISSGCGGSIISDQHILTAAHCVTISGTTIPKDPRTLRVVLGATQSPVQFPLSNCQELRSVRTVTVHQNYFMGNETTEWVSGDIAILELDRPIDFRKNPCVCRICLQNSEPAPGEICTISGFGCQVPTQPSSPCEDKQSRALMKLNVMMPGDDVCSSFFPDLPTKLVTCSASNQSHSPCFGDSGGPIVCYNNVQNTYYQAGVVSFAIFPDGVEKCGLAKWNFQYYTKVKGYLDWIQNEVPDIVVSDPGSFSFHASFKVDLGKGVSTLVANNQLLPNV